jgi:predicted SAM-dependent methyltransferase
MLHVAPEECLASRLRKITDLEYLSADLMAGAMVVMDITQIQYPDQMFDIVYCSHVLEHVLEDRKAMSEIRRVLKPQGWVVIVVPIDGKRKFEVPKVVDPKERERVFGQHDHVRIYGLDVRERLAGAGFKVRAVHPADLLSEAYMAFHAIPKNEGPIFFCTLGPEIS